MKVGILAGGLGTRLAEETELRPKPMVEIGGRPILWHIMKYYERFGFTDFSVALRLQGRLHQAVVRRTRQLTRDLTVDFASREVIPHGDLEASNWTVDLIDTGLDTATGGRIKRLQPHIGTDTCMVTWGDGVATSISRSCSRSTGRTASLPPSPPSGRRPDSGTSRSTATQIRSSTRSHRPAKAGSTVPSSSSNHEVFDYIDGDDTQFEREPLERLANDGQLMAYKHYDFWQCMDTIRDKKLLESLWAADPPWKRWS